MKVYEAFFHGQANRAWRRGVIHAIRSGKIIVEQALISGIWELGYNVKFNHQRTYITGAYFVRVNHDGDTTVRVLDFCGGQIGGDQFGRPILAAMVKRGLRPPPRTPLGS